MRGACTRLLLPRRGTGVPRPEPRRPCTLVPPPHTHIPHTAADDVEEIQAAVRTAIQACCLQLRSKIARAQAAREQRQRKKNLTKYIPNVAAALFPVLQAVVARPPDDPAGAGRAAGGDTGLPHVLPHALPAARAQRSIPPPRRPTRPQPSGGAWAPRRRLWSTAYVGAQ